MGSEKTSSTLRPRKSLSETVLPSTAGSVKVGAGVPRFSPSRSILLSSSVRSAPSLRRPPEAWSASSSTSSVPMASGLATCPFSSQQVRDRGAEVLEGLEIGVLLQEAGAFKAVLTVEPADPSRAAIAREHEVNVAFAQVGRDRSEVGGDQVAGAAIGAPVDEKDAPAGEVLGCHLLAGNQGGKKEGDGSPSRSPAGVARLFQPTPKVASCSSLSTRSSNRPCWRMIR